MFRPSPRSTLFPYTTLFRSIFTLCITPFRKLVNLPDLIRFRRMLGLFAFSYLCLHFLTYLLLDQSFDLDRKSTRLNSSHVSISYAVFCLKKKKKNHYCRIFN